MKCSKCGTQIDEKSKFCMLCGMKVVKDRKCNGCHSILPLRAKICMECGYILDEDKYLIQNGYDYDDFTLEYINDDYYPLGRISVGGKWGYRNSENQLVIPFEYDEVAPFEKLSDGTVGAFVKKDGLWGAINLDNETIIPFIFYYIIDCFSSLDSDRPMCGVYPTSKCQGWGRIFINKNLDISFDLGTKEKFFEQYPDGMDWFFKHEKHFGNILE